jgi:hypothetical protein
MAAPFNPPIKGEEFQFDVGLQSISSGGRFQVNPTIADGDALVYKDGGAGATLTNIPTAVTGTVVVKVSLTATEMDADKVTVVFRDLTASPEWGDVFICIPTTSS